VYSSFVEMLCTYDTSKLTKVNETDSMEQIVEKAFRESLSLRHGVNR